MIRLKEKGTTLTWGPGPSSDPGSEAIADPAAVAAAAAVAVAAVAAAGAPGVITPR
jgi:subtilisin family serine protease